MNERVDEGPSAAQPARRATVEGGTVGPAGSGHGGDAQAWFTGGHPAGDAYPAGETYPPASPRRRDPSAAPDRGDGDDGDGDGGDGGDGDRGGWDEDADTDLDLLEPSWTPPRRVNRLTVVLVAGILVAAGFGAGALVQKRHDQGLTAAASPASFARTFRSGTAGAGGFGGLGEAPGNSAPATGSDSRTAQGTAGTQGAGTQGAGVPVAVGTVVSVSGSTLTLKNFAGAQVVVHVPAGTPVTVPGLGGLRAGMTVSVTGTKASDGSVTAASVVSRSAG